MSVTHSQSSHPTVGKRGHKAMKAVAVYPGKADSVQLRDVGKPMLEEIPDGRDVLVKTLRVGMDGTDKGINVAEYGQAPPGSNHLILGHHSLGKVEAVGPNVTEFQPGDFVVATVRRPGNSLYDNRAASAAPLADASCHRGVTPIGIHAPCGSAWRRPLDRRWEAHTRRLHRRRPPVSCRRPPCPRPAG